MPDYTIRPTTMDDLLGFRTMQAASWLATYPSPEHGVSHEWVKNRVDGWFTPESLERSREFFQAVLDDPGQFHQVALCDDAIVGFVHVSTKSDGTKEFEAIYTAPETWGTGLADMLMRPAMEFIGDSSATVDVASYNHRAIRFYKKYGFRPVEGSDFYYADMMPAMQMKRGKS